LLNEAINPLLQQERGLLGSIFTAANKASAAIDWWRVPRGVWNAKTKRHVVADVLSPSEGHSGSRKAGWWWLHYCC